MTDRAALTASVAIQIDTDGDRLIVKGAIPVHALEVVPFTAMPAEVQAACDRVRGTLATAAQRIEERWAAENPSASTETP